MEYKQLGNTDLKVSALGLGCARLGSVTQVGGDQVALSLLGLAMDSGINFIDTADIYGQGRSETLIAKAIKSRRGEVVIATKAGYCLSPLGGIARHIKPLLRSFLKAKPSLGKAVQKARSSQSKQDFSSKYISGRIEASLRRLRLDALDLFYLHSPTTEIIRRGEIFHALEAFKSQGKIRHYGVSCLTASDAELCIKQPGVAVVQLEANLFTPEALSGLLPSARAGGVGVVARQIFAGAVLLRSALELTPELCGSRSEDFADVKARLEEFHRLAASAGVTLPQAALQYLVQTEAISNVLIGTTNPQHLAEHLATLKQPKLPPELMARFNDFALMPAAKSS